MYDKKQQTKEKRPAPSKTIPGASSDVKRRVRRMAGLPSQGRENYDPVSYVRDSFTQSFRAHGVAMSQLQSGMPDPELAGKGDREEEPVQEEQEEKAALELQEKTPEDRAVRLPTGGMEQSYMQTQSQAEHGMFLHKFADVSFHKGALAAGVLQGTGKMMLVSAVKDAYGKSTPTNQRQRTLFGDSSVEQSVPQTDATAVYNRGDVQSAVAMVTSSISAGSAMLEELRQAAKLAGEGKSPKSEALYKAYPFLSTQEERQAMQEYSQRLRQSDAQGEKQDKAVLEYGAQKTQALIEQKQSMCKRFAGVLENLGEFAQRAELEFSGAAAPDMVMEALTELVPDASGGAGTGEGGGAEAGAAAPDASVESLQSE